MPSFTRTPNNGNKIYVLDRASFHDLVWEYNPDGFTLEKVELLYVKPNSTTALVAKKVPGQQLQIFSSSGYSGRVEFHGRATFRILSVVPRDSRIFQCRLSFTNVVPPEFHSDAELVVVVPPSITLRSQSPVTLDEGQTRTLLCVANGNPKPSYTWRKDSSIIQQTSDSSFIITSTNKDHRGTYTCTAQVSAPGLSINPAQYSVHVIVRFRPQVTFLTSNQSLNDGFDAVFLCVAEAYPSPIVYEWFKDGNLILSDPHGQFYIDREGLRIRLRAKQLTKNSAGQYSCSGRNILGTGKRKSTFLAVNYAPQTVTVTADRDPGDVPLSQSITLTCQADGYPNPSFSWKFNGKIIHGAQQKTLLLTNAVVEDAGNYTCIATNFRGSKETTRVVNVEYRPAVTNLTIGTPGNAVVQGTTVTLTCSAGGYPAPIYTIRHGPTTVLTQNGGPGRVVINNIQLNAEDQPYSCVPSNKVGDGPTKQISITVQVPPTFSSTLPTTKQIRDENQTMSYSCTAEAKPAARILWVLNGQNLAHILPYNIVGSFQMIPNSKLFRTSGYLIMKRLTWRQYGNFSCIAYNDAGRTRQNTELEVRYRPVVQFPDDHPKNLTLSKGETATFTCKTIGNPPTTGHKWQFNGVDIPGGGCGGCTSITYTKAQVTEQDAGRYSCIGTNSMGDGPPARAQLLVKHKPTINVFPQSTYTVNETNSVTMVCGAEGVPEPIVTWRKTSNQKIVGYGKKFTIANTKGSDDGRYICIARNELGDDAKEVTLNVQTRPTITTSTPEATNIPVSTRTGEEVKLTCIVSAKPSAKMSWKRDLNGKELSSQNDNKVKGISNHFNAIEMTLTDAAVDEEFYCVAVNLLGNDTQEYRIRERGPPDPPINVKLVGVTVPNAKTVSVKVSWTPGYSGGFPQQFSVHYRKKGSNGDFIEERVGNPDNNMDTVKGLSPNTDYEFLVQATNERGKSQASAKAQVTTPGSVLPPDRGVVSAIRSLDDPTVIVVTWKVTDDKVTKLRLEIQKGEAGGDSGWQLVPGASDISRSKTDFKVENLKAGEKYRFRMDMRRPGEATPVYVESNTVPAIPLIKTTVPPTEWVQVNPTGARKGGLSTAEVSGIIVALLVVIIASSVCILLIERQEKARKKRSGETAKTAFANDAVEIYPGRDNMTPVCDESKDVQDQEA